MSGFWTLTDESAELRQALTATGAHVVVTSLRNAIEQIVAAASDAASHPPLAANRPLDAGILSTAE